VAKFIAAINVFSKNQRAKNKYSVNNKNKTGVKHSKRLRG